jgi:gliding-associated putative ABC transporter substrate-binding component GldG
MKIQIKNVLIIIFILLIVNFISSYFFVRLDLTSDSRYTLSKISHTILKNVDEPVYVDVYLDGDLPAEFKKLQFETKQILEEFEAYNNKIIFRFVKIGDDVNFTKQKELFKKGLTPINITVTEKGKQSQLMVFPWAIVNYKGKEANVPLLKNLMGANTEEKVVGSIQNLEYAFADAFKRVSSQRKKKIAIIKGNGELNDRNIAKFLLQLRESYRLAPITLDAVAVDAFKTQNALSAFDLAIIAKPTEKFNDEEKQVLDQYIINGGKTMWLIDQVSIDLDSLYNPEGATLALPRDLNLNDMFFKYGIRILPEIVKDEYGTPIKLATGAKGSETQFQEFNWKFAPFVLPVSNHPIVKNLGGIKFDFCNPIDVLKNDIQKTVILQSSPNSRKIGTPSIINLNVVNEETSPKDYQKTGNLPIGVLLEGNFHSVFENRVLAFKDSNFKSIGKKNKMIVIADGDLIKNDIDKNGEPLELGYDQKTGNLFDNKDLAINAVNYLLDDTGLINIRNKEVKLALLDKEKVSENYTQTQIIALIFPLVLLLIFGICFIFWRKKKYAR